MSSQNEWSVYTQRIAGGPPSLVKTKGRNAGPILSSDGTLVALHEEAGGIALYHADGQSPPTTMQAAGSGEYPVQFVEGGRALLVADTSTKEIALTVIDLATGHRQPWKRISLPMQRKSKSIVVTPDLKYYAYFLPRYSSNLYLVENLR